jgi:hypothetical protein
MTDVLIDISDEKDKNTSENKFTIIVPAIPQRNPDNIIYDRCKGRESKSYLTAITIIKYCY